MTVQQTLTLNMNRSTPFQKGQKKSWHCEFEKKNKPKFNQISH